MRHLSYRKITLRCLKILYLGDFNTDYHKIFFDTDFHGVFLHGSHRIIP